MITRSSEYGLENFKDFLEKMEVFLANNALDNVKHEESNSTQWLKRSFEASVAKSFFKYLLRKENFNKERYFDYLENKEILSEEARDSNRSAINCQDRLPSECIACGAKKPEYHHIIPHRYGGETKKENLAPLCTQCHEIVENYQTKLGLEIEGNQVKEVSP